MTCKRMKTKNYPNQLYLYYKVSWKSYWLNLFISTLHKNRLYSDNTINKFSELLKDLSTFILLAGETSACWQFGQQKKKEREKNECKIRNKMSKGTIVFQRYFLFNKQHSAWYFERPEGSPKFLKNDKRRFPTRWRAFVVEFTENTSQFKSTFP